MRTYNANGLAGCVEQRTSRQTGKLVSIYHNAQAGLDDCGGEYPYSTVCEAHGWIVAHRTLALARRHATDPMGWCEKCNGAFVDDRHEPAPAPAPAATKEPSLAQIGRQARRERTGRYARMYTCEGCGKRIGEDYGSYILPSSGAGLVLCGKCDVKVGAVMASGRPDAEAEAEKLLPYSSFLGH